MSNEQLKLEIEPTYNIVNSTSRNENSNEISYESSHEISYESSHEISNVSSHEEEEYDEEESQFEEVDYIFQTMKPFFSKAFQAKSILNFSDLNVSNLVEKNDPENSSLYSLIFEISAMFIWPVFVTIGIVINIFILCLMPRLAVRVSAKSKQYYIAIALFDLGFLLIQYAFWYIPEQSLMYLSRDRLIFRTANFNLHTSIVFQLLALITQNFSNYTSVCMAVERAIVIYFPLRSRSIKSNKNRFLLIILFWIPSIFDFFARILFFYFKQIKSYDEASEIMKILFYYSQFIRWGMYPILVFMVSFLLCIKLISMGISRKIMMGQSY